MAAKRTPGVEPGTVPATQRTKIIVYAKIRVKSFLTSRKPPLTAYVPGNAFLAAVALGSIPLSNKVATNFCSAP